MKKLLAGSALLLAFMMPVRAEWVDTAKAAPALKFTRFVEDPTGARLQTAVRSYRNKEGVKVDLVGAIHIADKAYYEKLNARFTRYDAMLYEMVGESVAKRLQWKAEGEGNHSKDDAETIKQENSAGKNLQWLHPLYETMQNSLGLTGQMNGVDYTAANFVHADMTLREFAATQQAKKESFASLWWKSVVVQMEHPEAAPEQPGLLKIMEILCRKDSTTELKRLMGRMFGSIDGMLAGMETEGGSVIIHSRNQVALSELENQISHGKKNLAIFYGAAHLPDMDKRLRAMGFECVGYEWFTAWDIPPSPPEPEPVKQGRAEKHS